MRMCHELMAPASGTGICSRQVIYLGPARRSNRHTVKAHCSGASGVLLQKTDRKRGEWHVNQR